MTHIDDPSASQAFATHLRAAIASWDLQAYAALLDENVRWGGADETPETCHTRAQVLERLATQRRAGLQIQLVEVVPGDDAVLVGFTVRRPVRGGFAREHTVYQVLKVRESKVTDIRGYGSRVEAAAQAGIDSPAQPSIEARQLVPILNVSNLADSFAWFARLGWSKRWQWSESGGQPSFGAVGSGTCEIFLCLNGQGGRGRGGGIGGGGQGVWLSIWVDDVDTLHAVCRREGIEILQPPRDEPFGVRELHVRHPDGHVFRMSQPIHSH